MSVRLSSIEHQIANIESGLLQQRITQFYNPLLIMGPSSHRMVSEELNTLPSSLTGARHKLMQLGLVEKSFKDYCEAAAKCPLQNKRKVIYWKCVPREQGELF